MLNVFTLINGRLVQKDIESLEDLRQQKAIWVDLEDPSAEEKSWVTEYFGVSIPDDATAEDIEESARFYVEENGEIHIRTDFLIDDDDPRAERVAFILSGGTAASKTQTTQTAQTTHFPQTDMGILFSIRNEGIPVFRLLRMRARRLPGFIEDAKDVLLKLFDADAEYCADTLEDVHDALENISKTVLKSDITDDKASTALSIVAHQEDINSWVKRDVMDSRRAVSFLLRSRMLSAEQFEEARQILRDMDSLDSHTSFLFDKINFLMDAIIGFININQNKIIKLFSVVSVALLPPTLIASIYGMNFRHMPPEIEATWGYPIALVLMVLSALLPTLYFKKRGWL